MEQAKLTPRQQEVLQFIIAYRTDQGYSPTYQEICEKFSISSRQGAARHIEALEKKGYIKRTPNTPRSLVPLRHVH